MESKLDVPVPFHEGRAAGNRVAPPEHAEEEQQKPERGLTLRLTGVPKARPS